VQSAQKKEIERVWIKKIFQPIPRPHLIKKSLLFLHIFFSGLYNSPKLLLILKKRLKISKISNIIVNVMDKPSKTHKNKKMKKRKISLKYFY